MEIENRIIQKQENESIAEASEKIKIINRGLNIIKNKIRTIELEQIKKEGLQITEKELNYLVWIDENNHINHTELSKVLGVTKGTLSTNIKLLIKKGLIIKTNNNENFKDKRIKKITVTSIGKKYINFFNSVHEKIYDKLVYILGDNGVKDLINIGKDIRDKL